MWEGYQRTPITGPAPRLKTVPIVSKSHSPTSQLLLLLPFLGILILHLGPAPSPSPSPSMSMFKHEGAGFLIHFQFPFQNTLTLNSGITKKRILKGLGFGHFYNVKLPFKQLNFTLFCK